MEATVGTDTTTVLEHNVEESGYLILASSSTEALSETAEKGCEPNKEYSTTYPDHETVYDNAGLYDHSGGEGKSEYDEGEVYDGYHGDGGIAYDETEAYENSYEHHEAIECEEGEAFDDINEDDRESRHPVAELSADSGHET